MYTYEQHLDNLIRHISLVREACTLLGKRLIGKGYKDFGRLLIMRGFTHDASKFMGIEWDFLHVGPDVERAKLDLAIKQHTRTNAHHPEFHGGIENMPPLDTAEMVCDWYARSQEFGTDLRVWFKQEAIERFGIIVDSDTYHKINGYIDILLTDSFQR